MKTFFVLTSSLALSIVVGIAETNLAAQKAGALSTDGIGTNSAEFTNLTIFGPPYGTNSIPNLKEMLKTNGLASWVETSRHPPVCHVYVYNRSTNDLACLRMPAKNLCRIGLFDSLGREVNKTALGRSYGEPLSQGQIKDWRQNWSDRHQSMFLRLIPNGNPRYANMPTEICSFKVGDAFEIKTPGTYELHIQLSLVQIGIDDLKEFHFPVTTLPEIVRKITIEREEILPGKNLL